MTTRAGPLAFRNAVPNFVMAGALIVVPPAALCVPEHTAPNAVAGALRTPLSVDTPAPAPTPTPSPSVSSGGADYYCGGCDGGGGGGGGG
ncbi:hypothetical protein [Mycobacterium sp. HNNTM2301]|uniref:hypothetical protein n=1 Tax=Mycobacterium hainanense TaxID=3289775 RepID=UPI0035A5CA85